MPRGNLSLKSVYPVTPPPINAEEVLPDRHESRNRFLYLKVLAGDLKAGETLDLGQEQGRFWESVNANITREQAGANTPRTRRMNEKTYRHWAFFWEKKADPADQSGTPKPPAAPRSFNTWRNRPG